MCDPGSVAPCNGLLYQVDRGRPNGHTRIFSEDDLKSRLIIAGMAVVAVFVLAAASPAQAVVYCDYVGVPKGCVARPGAVLRPAPVLRTPGVAGPGLGAPGVGVAPGPAGTANLGGPVNRRGVR